MRLNGKTEGIRPIAKPARMPPTSERKRYMTMPPAPPTAPAQEERNASWVRRHKILTGLGVAVVLFVIGGAFAGGGDGTPAASAGANAKPSAAASGSSSRATNSTKAAPREATGPRRIVFTVTGKAPRGVDVTYGSDSDDRSGNTTTDADGMPTAKLPWSRSLKLDDDVAYYMLSAQLAGGGDINCKLTIGGKTVAKGHASGEYNICSAQASPGLFGGWTAD